MFKVFVHVSTLYCGSSNVMDEKYYQVIDNPHDVIKNRGKYDEVLPTQ